MNRAVAVVCSFFTATLAAVAFSAGVAGASGPDLSGQTYGKAAEQLKGWGLDTSDRQCGRRPTPDRRLHSDQFYPG